jgi:hypothetical protein
MLLLSQKYFRIQKSKLLKDSLSDIGDGSDAQEYGMPSENVLNFSKFLLMWSAQFNYISMKFENFWSAHVIRLG